MPLKKSINNESNGVKNEQKAEKGSANNNAKLSSSPAMFRKISISEISLRRSALKGASDKHPLPNPTSVATYSPNFRRRSGQVVNPEQKLPSTDGEHKEDFSLLRKVMDRFKSMRTTLVTPEDGSTLRA
jgi:hypothetical protein